MNEPSDPDIRVTASQLELRLQRQSQWMAAAVVIGTLLGAMGLLLGLGTIGIGTSSGAWNFVTRGIAIIAISAIIMSAVWSLQPIRSLDATCALAQMLDLAIERAPKTLAVIRAGLYSCVIAAVFGLVGSEIRIHLGRPAKMSPIVGLLILGMIALVLVLCDRLTRRKLGQYRRLKQALTVQRAV